jgi:signal transduction histidine kinase
VINLRRFGEQWRRWDVTLRDLPLAVLLAVASLVPAFRGAGTTIGDLPTRPYDLLALAAILLQSLPLAVRRRWPLLTIVLVSMGFAVDQLRAYHTVAGIGFAIALISTGANLEQYRRLTAVLLSIAYLPFVITLHLLGSPDRIQDFVTFYLFLVVAWVIGAWWRHTRKAEAEHRRLIAETTRAAERTRIARDLHDVVTHHVTAMVVQTEAAKYLTDSPQRLDHALTGIADTGRRAISDLRDLLDLLNPDHGGRSQEPPLDDLRSLVEQTRQAGQPVEFLEDGVAEQLSANAELTAYRVVQESLTNALKYAHGGRTVVEVHREDRQITVRISTDESGSYASPGGSGRGLAGLKERVDMAGGEFSADREPGGHFVVQARIPAGSST